MPATERDTEQQEHQPILCAGYGDCSPTYGPSVHRRRPLVLSTVLRDYGYMNLGIRGKTCQGQMTQFLIRSTVLSVTENENPQPGLTPDWGFPLCYHSTLEVRDSLSRDRYSDYSFKVNQVESAFMPLRSILLPSHTANAMGTDIPALNCVSFASLFPSYASRLCARSDRYSRHP